MEWYWWLLVLIIVILIVWWALSRNAKATEIPKHEDELQHDHEGYTAYELPVQLPTEDKAVLVVESRIDDLEVIEGIGPKIASVLREAGITTFAQLAKEEPGNLKVILVKAGIHLAEPTSWAEQAKLAAEEDQEGLKALQDRLKGGRDKA